MKQKCSSCYLTMSTEKKVIFQCSAKINNYIKLLDRGGLKYATDYFNQVIASTYSLFQTLISDRFEKIFLNCSSDKQVLKLLALKN